MKIRDMFADDINRKINGVIKVDQAADDVIEQELNEYVITRELKKHFITFFNYYGDAFEQPTADMGVWISGFFGSGKSHFLKMLSYLLKNKEVKGVRSAERFRKKFEDDPATFMLIDRAAKGKLHTGFCTGGHAGYDRGVRIGGDCQSALRNTIRYGGAQDYGAVVLY